MRSLMLALAAALATTAPATADVIDFLQLGSGDLGTTSATVDGVTFSSPVGLYVLTDAPGGSLCSFNASAFNCQNDMTIRFNGKVKRLSFDTLGHNEGDQITVNVYRGRRLLGTEVISSNTQVQLSGYRRVTRIEIDDASTGAGYSYADFRFRRVVAGGRADRDEVLTAAAGNDETSAQPAAARSVRSGARDGARAGGGRRDGSRRSN